MSEYLDFRDVTPHDGRSNGSAGGVSTRSSLSRSRPSTPTAHAEGVAGTLGDDRDDLRLMAAISGTIMGLMHERAMARAAE